VAETSAAHELLPLMSVAVVALGCRLRHALTEEALHFLTEEVTRNRERLLSEIKIEMQVLGY
jgi:hypothetical protein